MSKSTLEFLALGKTAKTMVPSGRVFVIREQNGNDDEILSNPVTQIDQSNVDNFLYAIITEEIIGTKSVKVTLDDVKSMLVNDRTHLLIFSRVNSLGELIKFEFNWGDDKVQGGKYPYEEDLRPYLHDYTKDFPKEGEPGYFKYKIPPYPLHSDKPFEFETISGKKLRFSLLNRQGELEILQLKPEERHNNAAIRARNLELQSEDGKWVKVENFTMFSKRDMVEIQKAILDIDRNYQFLSDIEHPTTKQMVSYPLMSYDDFFFPVEA